MEARGHHPEWAATGRPFVFVHVGDLHLTDPAIGTPAVQRRAQRVVDDLGAIFGDIAAANTSGRSIPIDFLYLPGDIAQNGCASEYALLNVALAGHPGLPLVRLIPGDHDRQHGSMNDFALFRETLPDRHGHRRSRHKSLSGFPDGCPPHTAVGTRKVEQFYFAETHAGVRCLFLDMVSAGHGREGFGLDFRLGEKQFAWLCGQIMHAAEEQQPVAVFQHAYPADMRNPDDTDAKALAGLFWNAAVRLVEMGHTHYNELAPDGRTLYAAARSVGQNEDGPVGYAVAAVDGDAVSWRFKQLQQTWPFVLITSPADRRLATAAPHRPLGPDILPVRAVALSDSGTAACTCEFSVDGGAWTDMIGQGNGLFTADVPWPPGSRSVSVCVTDGRWQQGGQDFVDVDTVEPASPDVVPPRRPDGLGSDARRLRASWPGKGLRGDQLGPNRGGRKW